MKQMGFTLIELLIIVAIVLIPVSVIITTVYGNNATESLSYGSNGSVEQVIGSNGAGVSCGQQHVKPVSERTVFQ